MQDAKDMLVYELHEIFNTARDEIFEDGMDSAFSVKLNRIICTHGVPAIEALERIMCMDSINAAVTEEALRQVGNLDDEGTHNRRLSLLVHALESRDPGIRDAASIGIEFMNDPTAIKSIQKAIDGEKYEHIQQNLVLGHLLVEQK